MKPINAPQLADDIISQLPFTPNELQLKLIAAISDFMASSDTRGIFLLNGYAGSGKTSIMGALIKALKNLKIKTATLAPTGRAAKVAANFSAGKSSTIHRRIFRPESDAPGSGYIPAPNNSRDTLFIVDEASLIQDSPSKGNSLLWQLLRYVYSAPGNKAIFVGDVAQLPPIGMEGAPAMNIERLSQIGLTPTSFTLDLPMRQAESGGILHNATNVRQLIFAPIAGMQAEIVTRGYEDVQVISSMELADCLSDSWAQVGVENSIIITRSNSRANRYNMAIRNMVMMAEEPLQQGDRLVIAKNDYFWSKINKLDTFIANGDMAEVKWVGKTEKMYGRFFTEVELQLQTSPTPISAKIMLRSLMCDGPAIPRAEMDKFYTHVLAEYEGELSEKIKGTMEDEYYNALQAKYGYCITCHKAQGGQWKHVYIDMSGIDPAALDETFYRWLYTAITRATEKVFFINPTIPTDLPD